VTGFSKPELLIFLGLSVELRLAMIRILLVDDQKFIREALRSMLEPVPDLQVVGTASDGHTAIEQVALLRPDVVLIDVEMPGLDGVSATQVISQKFMGVKVLVLSIHDNEEQIARALRAGAIGYLLKNTPAAELREAIRFAHRGYAQIGPGLLSHNVSRELFISATPSSNSTAGIPPTRTQFHQPLSKLSQYDDGLDAQELTVVPLSQGFNPLNVLRRRWLPMLAMFSTVMIAVVVNTLWTKPMYESEAWLLVAPKRSAIAQFEPGDSPSEEEAKARQTEVQTLRSSPLIGRAIARLPKSYQRLTIKDIQKNLSTYQSEEDGLLSNIIVVSYSDTEPKRVKAVLEALSSVYVDHSLNISRSRLTNAVKFIEQNLPSVRTNVNQSSTAIRQFRERYGFVDPTSHAAALSASKQDLEKEIQTSTIALKQTQRRIQSIRAELRKVGHEPRTAAVYAVLGQDSNYQALVKQLQDLLVQINLQQVRLQDDHPTMQALREQYQQVLTLIRGRAGDLLGGAASQVGLTPTTSNSTGQSSELPRVKVSDKDSVLSTLTNQLLQTQIEADVQRIQLSGLNQAYIGVNEQFRQTPKLQQSFAELERQVTLSSKNLEQLLQKHQELRIAAAEEISPWSILEPPVLPDEPSSPDLKRNLQFGVIIGSFLSIGIALLLERLDRRLKTIEAVKGATGLSVLGAIPSIKSPESVAMNEAQALSTSPNYLAFHEALRSLSINLQALSTNRTIKTLAIASAVPSEGKSTIAYSLGITMARLGQRVLVVDADMRQPRLHMYAHCPNERGLSTAIMTEQNWSDLVIRDRVPNLDLLTTGLLPPDPLALLWSEKMAELLQIWSWTYDYVLIDTPAISSFADLQGLACQVDGIAVVVSLERTTTIEVNQAMEVLKANRNKLIGLIVNRVDKRHEGYCLKPYTTSGKVNSYPILSEGQPDPRQSHDQNRPGPSGLLKQR
jgi:polysaccharide biosynthesis transport protein